MRIFKPRFKGRDGTYREATNYAMEFEAGGKRTVKSLQTPNRATAEARAKLLMAQTRDRGWEILKPRLPGARSVSRPVVRRSPRHGMRVSDIDDPAGPSK